MSALPHQLPHHRERVARGSPNRVKAKLVRVKPDYFAQHEISEAKVLDIIEFLQSGGSLPPPVAVQYGARFMPIDGHHRFEAHARLARDLDVWAVPGPTFERLDARCRAETDFSRAEDFILCGDVTAMMVAPRVYGKERSPAFPPHELRVGGHPLSATANKREDAA